MVTSESFLPSGPPSAPLHTPVPSDDRLAALVDAGACWNAALSPDGRSVAFLADAADCPQVFLSPTAFWTPRQITSGPHEVVDLAWSADGGLLGYAVAPGGGDRTQLHVVDADGRNPRPMFVAHNESAFPGVWTRDGRGYAFSTTLGCSGTGCTAYLLDLRESTLLPLGRAEPGEGRVLVTDLAPDRRRTLLRTGPRGRRGTVIVDRSVARRVPLTELDATALSGSAESARFSGDGASIFFRTDIGREFPALASVTLDLVGDPGPMQIVAGRDDAELDSFALSGDRATGLLLWNAEGWSELDVWDPATGNRRAVLLPERGVIGGVGLDATGRTAVFDQTGPTSPRTLWLLDVATGETRPLGVPPGAAPPPSGLVPPTLEHFDAHDGLRLSGWLYRPPGRRGPGPTVLSFHGGPEAQERPGYSPLFQALLDEGIAVFAPNVRGSTGYGRTFEELDTAEGRFDAVRDVAAAAAFVVASGVAEPGRIGIHGASYGGYLALAGITEFPSLFDAAVDVCGIANFETFFATTEPWMAETSRRKYGDPATQAEMLRALSPIHRMDRVRTPTLVVHGVNDRNVPLRESEQVVEALTAHGVPVEQLLLDDSGHCLRGRPARLELATAAVDWFVRHLGGAPAGRTP